MCVTLKDMSLRAPKNYHAHFRRKFSPLVTYRCVAFDRTTRKNKINKRTKATLTVLRLMRLRRGNSANALFFANLHEKQFIR